MKKLLSILLVAAVTLCARGAQPANVQQDPITKNLTSDVTVPSGRTFSIGAGGILNWNASASFTGSASAFRTAIGAGTSNFDGVFASLTSKPTTLAGYGITDPIVLTSGSYANPGWITALANSKITGAYTAGTQTLATARILGRTTAGTGQAEELTASSIVDLIGATRGSVLYRGASGWAILTPGSAGNVLTSNGAGADPSYSAAGGSAAWGAITGTLSAQTDLQAALDAKQPLAAKLTALAGMTWTTNSILYAPTSSTVAALATANSGLLVTSSGGVPSIGTDIPTGITIGGAFIYRVGGTDVAVTDGGTGLSSGTSGGLLYFSGTTTIASSGALTANQIVLGGGAGAAPISLGSLGTTATVLHGNAAGAPTFGAVSLTTEVANILPGANGGTNNGFIQFTGPAASLRTFTLPNASATILTDNAVVSVLQGGTGQSSYTDGQLLIGNTTGNTLAKGTLTGTANQISIANGSGSITLSLPQSIATTSTPQFANTWGTSSALTYNGTSMAVDFSGDGVKTVTVTSGNCTFTASNQTSGVVKQITLVIDNSGNASATNFTLPAWKFFNAAAPTSLAAGKTGVFTLVSTSTTAASVLAEYAATP